MSTPKLHHAAKRIAPGSLETVIEMFELLGCKVSYRPEGMRWAMVAQDGLDFDIQLIETEAESLEGAARPNSQIAFISDQPEEDIARVRDWAESRGLRFAQNAWTDREFYFDLPDLFTDWVVEIMHVSVIEN